MVNPPAYVSIAGLTLTVDPTLTILADVGPHTISVLVSSLDYPVSVAAVTYTFALDVQHCVATVMTLPAIANVAFTLN